MPTETAALRPESADADQITVSVVDSLAKVSASAWCGLTQGTSLYLSQPWLSLWETDGCLPPRYLLAHDGRGRLVGTLPTYRTTPGGVPRFYDHGELLLRPALGEGYRPEAWQPALLGGARSGGDNAILVDRSLHPEARTAVLAKLLARGRQLGVEAGARSLAFMYLSHADARDVAAALNAPGPLFLTAGTRLDLQAFRTFGDYLESFNHRRRGAIRHEISNFEAAGCTLGTGRLGEWADELARLNAALEQKYGASPEPGQVAAAYRQQASALAGHDVVFVCRRGRQVLGLVLFFEWDGILYSRGLGLDYMEPRASAVYFNLGYYGPIRYAIDRGLKAIDFSLESYAAKVLRGATLRSLWSVVVALDADASAGVVPAAWNDRQRQAWSRRLGELMPRPSEAFWGEPSP